MISKEDWRLAYEQMLEEGRQKFEPPTVEEVEKLFNGELEGEEAERVRDVLSYYPEIARAMTIPFPEEDDPGVSNVAEMEAGLAEIRRRARPPRRRQFRVFAYAASIVVLIGMGGLVYQQSQRTPLTTKILLADGARGGSAGPRGSLMQPPIDLYTETRYRLQPVFHPSHAYREYRLDLYDFTAPAPRIAWSGRVQRAPDGSFPFELSTKGYAPGTYRLVLFGVDDAPAKIAVYSIHMYER
ncbi:MAG: hypothetical protein JOZ54_04740 [Acidobacteria bacterium]|nr:hypothetical protein [Acidobacteriota bacterium]